MRIDLRVCRIVKAQEIRKSHSCLKITLDDGIKERMIVSSIKNEYTTEELIGKKIIEEAGETWMAAEYEGADRTAEEMSQLLYHVQVMMIKHGLTLEDVYKHL